MRNRASILSPAVVNVIGLSLMLCAAQPLKDTIPLTGASLASVCQSPTGCFTRYASHILHNSHRIKRSLRIQPDINWDACPPGVNPITCFDKYVNNIRLLRKRQGNDGFEESIMCKDYEPLAACYDRHIVNVDAPFKRDFWEEGTNFCAPGEEKVTCFDKYIDSMKLRSANSGEDCGTSDYRVECVQEIIRAIRMRDLDLLRKRGIMCGPGDVSVNCFDQYVSNLKVQRGVSKRRVYQRSPMFNCATREDDLTCFDRYISEMKLMDKKRSSFSCVQDEDELQCLDRYVKELKLKSPGTSSCGLMEGQTSCFNTYMTDIEAREGKQSPICNYGEDELVCLDRYVSVKDQSSRTSVSKRVAKSRCELGEEGIRCLDKFISAIPVQVQPNKRKQEPCRPGEKSLSCFSMFVSRIRANMYSFAKRSQVDAMEKRSFHQEDYYDVMSLWQNLMILRDMYRDFYSQRRTERSTGDAQSRAKRDLSELCPQNMDNLVCFDHYVSRWANKLAAQSKRTFRVFPGKRDAQRSRQKRKVCPENMDQVKCFDQLIGNYINQLVPVQSKVRHFIGRS